MSDLRPTLFLAQLPNLLAGNISLVHGVVGSSRTFMGEEASGADALRVAHARIAAGQSDIMLVGGAYNGTRWDLVLLFRLGTPLLEAPFRPVWDRGPDGALALAAMGAFVVLESRAHAEKRGAKPMAQLSQVLVQPQQPRRRAIPRRPCGSEWKSISKSHVKRDCAVVISGASGAEPATSEERQALERIGLPVRCHHHLYRQWDGGAVSRQYRDRLPGGSQGSAVSAVRQRRYRRRRPRAAFARRS